MCMCMCERDVSDVRDMRRPARIDAPAKFHFAGGFVRRLSAGVDLSLDDKTATARGATLRSGRYPPLGIALGGLLPSTRRFHN